MSAKIEVGVGKEYFRQEGPCVQKTERSMGLEHGGPARKGHG